MKPKMRTVFLLAGLLVVLGVLPAGANSKATIKKCQDATGKWHYGDSAADACAQSKVSIISEQGVTKKEIAAPLTAEQLKQRAQQHQDTEKAKEQQKLDELLLATYANEADIIYIRDRKLAQLESTIRASNDTLTPMRNTLGRLEAQAETEAKAGGVTEQTAKALEQTRLQISKHESVVAQKRQEQEQLRARAEHDLARFRALKAQPQKSAGAASR